MMKGEFLRLEYELRPVSGKDHAKLSASINEALKRQSEPSARNGQFHYAGKIINMLFLARGTPADTLVADILIEWSVYHED